MESCGQSKGSGWLLRDLGFVEIYAEELNMDEKFEVLREVSLIVGAHGAGLTNLLFAPAAGLIELFGNYGGGNFYSLATSLGQPYGCLPCAGEGPDIVVDIKALRRAVETMETTH